MPVAKGARKCAGIGIVECGSNFSQSHVGIDHQPFGMNTQSLLRNPVVSRSLAFEQPVHAPPVHRELACNLVERTPAQCHECTDKPLHLLDKTQIMEYDNGLQVFFQQGKLPGVSAGNCPRLCKNACI